LTQQCFEEELWAEPPFFDIELETPSLAQEPVPARSQPSSGDRIRLRMGELSLVIYGGAFQEMMALVKAIPGRRFDADDRVWVLPETIGLDSLRQRLAAAGFDLSAES
jgi:hypothetical protein